MNIAVTDDERIAVAAGSRTGVDVHGGLRVRLENVAGTIKSKWSGEPTVTDPRADVLWRLERVRELAGYLEAWLMVYDRGKSNE